MRPLTSPFHLAIGLTGALCACGDTTGPSLDELRPDVTPWVTASVARHLDPSGHFVFPTPPEIVVRPTISSDQAVRLATAFVRSFITNPKVITLGSTSFRQEIEKVHGAPIAWDRLKPAPWPPFYMEHPVLPVADSIPGYLRRYLGPSHHVLFFASGPAVLDVAVSVYATELAIRDDGGLQFPPPPAVSGEEVEFAGLPAAYESALPLIPEAAVRNVAEATGARIAELPRLFHPWNRYHPVYSRWRLRLDREIEVVRQDTGEPQVTAEIYVGHWTTPTGSVIQWFIAGADQPTSTMFPFAWPRDSSSAFLDSLLLHFDPEIPTRLVPVNKP